MPSRALHRLVALVAAVLLTACGGDVQPLAGSQPSLAAVGGPETVLIRFPLEGGIPSAYRLPRADSAIWTARDRLPDFGTVLAFDDGGGLLALTSASGTPSRLDLRSGLLQLPDRVMRLAASADGWSLFGATEDNHLHRSTPTSDWRGPLIGADTIIALTGGAVVLVVHDESRTRLIRIQPPDSTERDTLEVDRISAFVRTVNGDRLYGLTDGDVVAIDVRTWATAPGPSASRSPLAIAPTPSGDRVLVLAHDGREIRVWHRYQARYTGTITLPGPASALRMDPFGRYALARAELADSAYVISVPLRRHLTTIASAWREDLPTFAPDGSALAVQRFDVAAIDPDSGTRRYRVRRGALDYWAFVRWDGFKPRDAALDQPVTFAMETPADSAAEFEKIDSLLAAHAERAAGELDSVARATAGTQNRTDSAAVGFTLSFASLLSESAARAVAERIRVEGRRPRVVATSRDGMTIYRVIAGPFATREAAEEAGRRTGVPFWVFAGLP